MVLRVRNSIFGYNSSKHLERGRSSRKELKKDMTCHGFLGILGVFMGLMMGKPLQGEREGKTPAVERARPFDLRLWILQGISYIL